ncbi:MAG: tripartite tricarboxylate transporter substrate binding protein [Deltaproteobacteria bacterium]|nr:tripartite tricarboxylate transporter substrate binding protein [Deltaproteobacteria bacterium]
MKTTRAFIVIAATMVVATLAVTPVNVLGQGFKPTRAVDVVNHSRAGGGSDLFARALVQMLEQEKLIPPGWQVLNKAAGAGAQAMAYLAEKKGDPHTISVFTNTWVVTSLTVKETTYTIDDFTPLVRMILEPTVAVIKGDSLYKNLKDFVEDAKKKPGQLIQVGGTVSSVDNLFRNLIQKTTGAKWQYVDVRSGGERIANLLGGHMHIYFAQPAEVSEHVRAGNVKIIAALTESRLEGLPNVSTIKEQGIDVPIITQVRGAVGPPAMPKDRVQYWEGLFLRLTKTASWKKYVKENEVESAYLNSEQLGASLKELSNQLRETLKEAGVKVVR